MVLHECIIPNLGLQVRPSHQLPGRACLLACRTFSSAYQCLPTVPQQIDGARRRQKTVAPAAVTSGGGLQQGLLAGESAADGDDGLACCW